MRERCPFCGDCIEGNLLLHRRTACGMRVVNCECGTPVPAKHLRDHRARECRSRRPAPAAPAVPAAPAKARPPGPRATPSPPTMKRSKALAAIPMPPYWPTREPVVVTVACDLCASMVPITQRELHERSCSLRAQGAEKPGNVVVGKTSVRRPKGAGRASKKANAAPRFTQASLAAMLVPPPAPSLRAEAPRVSMPLVKRPSLAAAPERRPIAARSVELKASLVPCPHCSASVAPQNLAKHVRRVHDRAGVPLVPSGKARPIGGAASRHRQPADVDWDSAAPEATTSEGVSQHGSARADERSGLGDDLRDAKRHWGHTFREFDGEFGSYPVHEPHDDESGPE